MDRAGADVTESFILGASQVLEIARMTGAGSALLKEKSPSCGVNFVCGDGMSRPASGVLTALLLKNGIKVTGIE